MAAIVRVHREIDECPDLSWLANEDNYQGLDPESIATYMQQDRERLDAYERGDWHMVGVIATLTIDGSELLTSSLWGIESDSGEEYFRQVEEELTAELAHGIPGMIASLEAFVKEHAQ